MNFHTPPVIDLLPSSAPAHIVPILIRVPDEIVGGKRGAVVIRAAGHACPLTHWWSGREIVGIMRVYRVEHGVIE